MERGRGCAAVAARLEEGALARSRARAQRPVAVEPQGGPDGVRVGTGGRVVDIVVVSRPALRSAVENVVTGVDGAASDLDGAAAAGVVFRPRRPLRGVSHRLRRVWPRLRASRRQHRRADGRRASARARGATVHPRAQRRLPRLGGNGQHVDIRVEHLCGHRAVPLSVVRHPGADLLCVSDAAAAAGDVDHLLSAAVHSFPNRLPVIRYDEGLLRGLDVDDDEHDRDDDVPICTICLSEYERADEIRKLPCGHHFHRQCVDQWLLSFDKSCPQCRTDVDATADGGGERGSRGTAWRDEEQEMV
eukprot:ctg_321.g90